MPASQKAQQDKPLPERQHIPIPHGPVGIHQEPKRKGRTVLKATLKKPAGKTLTVSGNSLPEISPGMKDKFYENIQQLQNEFPGYKLHHIKNPRWDRDGLTADIVFRLKNTLPLYCETCMLDRGELDMDHFTGMSAMVVAEALMSLKCDKCGESLMIKGDVHFTFGMGVAGSNLPVQDVPKK